jgi:hypothetical protein
MDSITRCKPRDRMNAEGAKQRVQSQTPPVSPPLLPMAPRLVLLFWMLLGAVAGVTLAQGVWKLAGLTTGVFAIAVPVGAVGEAVGGGLIGRITRPHLRLSRGADGRPDLDSFDQEEPGNGCRRRLPWLSDDPQSHGPEH